MDNTAILEKVDVEADRIGKIVVGARHEIGRGFTATHFSEEMFGGRMDPLLMVDHFEMTGPTFEPHLHAGISAVTAMFEDSKGGFVNRDTLGNNITLQPGDLYWLTAGSGAVHEETPEAGARTHALQIFVNLPARLKKDPARALHVPANSVPVLESQGYRVRVLLGRSGDATGATGTPEAMTMLDALLKKDGGFTHRLPAGWHGWIYAVTGKVIVEVDRDLCVLKAGSATTVGAGAETEVLLKATEPSHVVFIAANPVGEPFVKHGPVTMSSIADVRQTLASYAEGRFGRIPT